MDGYVLLLGTQYDTCTTFHLAEYRIGNIKTTSYGTPILSAGKRVWKTYFDIDFDTDCFIDMGEGFDKAGYVKISQVGSAQAKILAVRDADDFGVNWLK